MEVDLSRMDVVVSLYAHLGFGAMHNKYLVVDRSETSITGSNIQVYSNYNAWNWHDFGLRMCGPVARQALASFQHFYTKSKNYRLVVEKRDERLLWQPIQAEKLSNHERGDQDHDPLPVCTNEGKTRILALTQDAWQVPVFAPSSPQTVGWKAVMRNAKKMIHIASPNIGSSEFIEEIVKSAVRGVKVKILSSKDFNDWAYSTLTARLIGFGNTNQKAVQLIRSKIEAEAIRLNDLSLLKNIEIRWYSGDGIRHAQGNGAYACHAKVMVADSRIVIAGSGNHDKLSWNYASEFNLLLDDKQLAEQINWRVFDLDWNRSFEQTFNQD
jgi:phosphatidylserine/phosphatidylglycerophosphate/cardiolipin synthase-like enzyme